MAAACGKTWGPSLEEIAAAVSRLKAARECALEAQECQLANTLQRRLRILESALSWVGACEGGLRPEGSAAPPVVDGERPKATVEAPALAGAAAGAELVVAAPAREVVAQPGLGATGSTRRRCASGPPAAQQPEVEAPALLAQQPELEVPAPDIPPPMPAEAKAFVQVEGEASGKGKSVDMSDMRNLAPGGIMGSGRMLFRGHAFWQELLPEHAVGAGLEFHVGLDSGRNLARLVRSGSSKRIGKPKLLPDDDPKYMAAAVCVPDSGTRPDAELVEKAVVAAASWGDRYRLRRLLASCHVPARLCVGALSEAAGRGHEEIVSELLRARASPSASSSAIRKTPLHFACEQGHEGVARLLLGAKAQLGAADSAGRTPCDLAREQDLGMLAKRLEREATQAGWLTPPKPEVAANVSPPSPPADTGGLLGSAVPSTPPRRPLQVPPEGAAPKSPPAAADRTTSGCSCDVAALMEEALTEHGAPLAPGAAGRSPDRLSAPAPERRPPARESPLRTPEHPAANGCREAFTQASALVEAELVALSGCRHCATQTDWSMAYQVEASAQT
eukprot:CAMPEP_0175460932 /NCGR_PEP_ID=MMETSP0095-20121207/67899_1 /TAXON_ID=311494 /ORGANISM="Alexandrium monilatum, Strain CCMP3105" /LENGTH=560 /DNA_ID=CAMNT_0016761969 /DNA_START=15 /DNA_END=1693 /DNA_ORIENTATION=-